MHTQIYVHSPNLRVVYLTNARDPHIVFVSTQEEQDRLVVQSNQDISDLTALLHAERQRAMQLESNPEEPEASAAHKAFQEDSVVISDYSITKVKKLLQARNVLRRCARLCSVL